jgi:acyl carrier protein
MHLNRLLIKLLVKEYKFGNIMNKIEILLQINELFAKELEMPELKLGFETTAFEVEEWDSITHVQLMVAVEKRFGVRFSSKELMSFACVGDIVSVLNERLG